MADISEDNEDIPPLEDMSEEINRRFNSNISSKETKHSYLEAENSIMLEKKRHDMITNLISGGETTPKSNLPKENKSKDVPKKLPVETSKATCKDNNFCGFKKGFLLQQKNKSDKNKQETNDTTTKKNVEKIKSDDLIEVKVNKDTKKNENVLPDVQKAMESPLPTVLQSKDWVTPDLLENVLKNPKLAKHFNDPNFNEAINLFQTNPQKVMQMCKKNAEMREFITEFANLMGNHFTKLGEQEVEGADKKQNGNQKTDIVDKKQIDKILQNEEVKKILEKQEIQKLLFLLKTHPENARRFMQHTDGVLRSDIQRLIDVGLLHFGAG